MHPSRNDIGAYVATKFSLAPQSMAASATANGSSVDRLGASSAVLVGLAGAATGTPTGVSVTYKIQDSADGSTFADVTSITDDVELTAVSSAVELDVDLTGLRRYIRVVATTALTGGTTPTILVAGCLILGGQDTLPA